MHFKATKASSSVVHNIFGQQLMGKHILQDIDLGCISIGCSILVSTNHFERRTVTRKGSKVVKNILLHENMTNNENMCMKVWHCPFGVGFGAMHAFA